MDWVRPASAWAAFDSSGGHAEGLGAAGLQAGGDQAGDLDVVGVHVEGLGQAGPSLGGFEARGLTLSGLEQGRFALGRLALSCLEQGGLALGGLALNGFTFKRLALNGLPLGGFELSSLEQGGLTLRRFTLGGGLQQGGLALRGLAFEGLALGGVGQGGLALGGLEEGDFALRGLALGGLPLGLLAEGLLLAAAGGAATGDAGGGGGDAGQRLGGLVLDGPGLAVDGAPGLGAGGELLHVLDPPRVGVRLLPLGQRGLAVETVEDLPLTAGRGGAHDPGAEIARLRRGRAEQRGGGHGELASPAATHLIAQCDGDRPAHLRGTPPSGIRLESTCRGQNRFSRFLDSRPRPQTRWSGPRSPPHRGPVPAPCSTQTGPTGPGKPERTVRRQA